jgi:hypothetical protein
MSEAWYDPNWYAWIPGSTLGLVGGLWGALVGILAPRGRARSFVVGYTWAVLVACAGLLAAGAVALVCGQPYGVWFFLGLPGLIGLIVIGANAPTVYWAYRAAEAR